MCLCYLPSYTGLVNFCKCLDVLLLKSTIHGDAEKIIFFWWLPTCKEYGSRFFLLINIGQFSEFLNWIWMLHWCRWSHSNSTCRVLVFVFVSKPFSSLLPSFNLTKKIIDRFLQDWGDGNNACTHQLQHDGRANATNTWEGENNTCSEERSKDNATTWTGTV